MEGTKLTFADFKEMLLRAATLAKFKLGGLHGDDQDLRASEEEMKKKLLHFASSTAIIQTLKEAKSSNSKEREGDSKNVSIFEREFDVSNMTASTLENLFKSLGFKGNKAMIVIRN